MQVLFYSVMAFLDSNVRLAAIKCLTEIVVLECTTEEQIALLCSNNCDENSNSEQKSWTVCYCLESIEVSNKSIHSPSLNTTKNKC